jgi:hypothetical protein
LDQLKRERREAPISTPPISPDVTEATGTIELKVSTIDCQSLASANPHIEFNFET